MRHLERFVKQPRLQLSDGTRLGSQFSQRVWDALDREEIRRVMTPLPSGWVRVKASWGKLYDCPPEKIWWLGTAKQLDPGMTIVDSKGFQDTDAEVLRTLKMVTDASSQKRRTIRLGDGTRLSAGFSQRVWDAQARQDKPQKRDRQILRTFYHLLTAVHIDLHAPA
jgi:hypothetical protein